MRYGRCSPGSDRPLDVFAPAEQRRAAREGDRLHSIFDQAGFLALEGCEPPLTQFKQVTTTTSITALLHTQTRTFEEVDKRVETHGCFLKRGAW